jgi:hypothetical protein
MSALQFVGLVFGVGLLAFAVLLVLGPCKVAGEADEAMERMWQEMKGRQE